MRSKRKRRSNQNNGTKIQRRAKRLAAMMDKRVTGATASTPHSRAIKQRRRLLSRKRMVSHAGSSGSVTAVTVARNLRKTIRLNTQSLSNRLYNNANYISSAAILAAFGSEPTRDGDALEAFITAGIQLSPVGTSGQTSGQ